MGPGRRGHPCSNLPYRQANHTALLCDAFPTPIITALDAPLENMSRPNTIAIDGPVASGKTSAGRMLAGKLGYRFLDTGLMYRALTWAAVHNNIDPMDTDTVVRLAQEPIINVHFDDSGVASVYLGDWDATPYLRDPDVERYVSQVSRLPAVRRELVRHQRIIARSGPIVMAGRDIGTEVLANADIKLFLTASAELRARRRSEEQSLMGLEPSFEEVLMEIQGRDLMDSQRRVGPLKPAEDAHIIHTDELSLEQVVEWAMELIEEMR